jgi:hypothetical protein
MKVKLCVGCKYSIPEPGSVWNLRCTHPEVNSKDPWALADAKPHGSSARQERSKRFLASCGMSGKLWEPK